MADCSIVCQNVWPHASHEIKRDHPHERCHWQNSAGPISIGLLHDFSHHCASSVSGRRSHAGHVRPHIPLFYQGQIIKIANRKCSMSNMLCSILE